VLHRNRFSVRPAWSTLVLSALTVAGVLLVWWVSRHTPDNLVRTALSVGGAGLVAYLATRRPVAAFGIVFLLASLSLLTIDTPIGNMRLEQPAIAAGLVAILVSRRWPDRETLRRLAPLGVGFGVYLIALTASSLLYATDRGDSLRMVAWYYVSIGGGLLAFLLLVHAEPEEAPRWLRLAGTTQATIGTIIALVFFSLGPVVVSTSLPMPGMGSKVSALSWEPNLYASLLAALSFFLVERLRARPTIGAAALAILVLFAMAFGVTRGATIGLAAGLVAYFALILFRRTAIRSLILPAFVSVVVVVVGLQVAPAVVAWGRPLTSPLDYTVPGWGRNLGLGGYELPGLPDVFGPWESVAKASPSPATSPVPGQSSNQVTPSVSPTPSLAAAPTPIDDTLTFRLDRVPVALKDLTRDPIIGLGANSFGQRHIDTSQFNNQPDHIAILAVAVLYESGIAGAIGLALGFGWILISLWRASAYRPRAPLAAAYTGSLVCLLVSYQATNALNFSLIWLIAGAGMALASGTARKRSEAEPAQEIVRTGRDGA
jgi:hypothetical protein